MKPIGKQWASGLSLLLSAIRFCTSSAAHSLSGSPSLKPAPTLKKVAFGGPPFAVGAGAAVPGRPSVAAPPRPPPVFLPLSQMPDKSGFPSAVLGAGAVRSSCPAAVLGTRGDGVEGHCAETTGVSKASAAITRPLRLRSSLKPPHLSYWMAQCIQAMPPKQVSNGAVESFQWPSIGWNSGET
jgi:hypothetical protein